MISIHFTSSQPLCKTISNKVLMQLLYQFEYLIEVKDRVKYLLKRKDFPFV